ncbi:kelch-like protein 29 [Asterias rubens]|uniref:kelch-like protein 29 n=1 Tax=Asterias rubens TaxID=7604 RepID=UPI0014551352|nr:kelch-like protein 29 [Asterias rubens]
MKAVPYCLHALSNRMDDLVEISPRTPQAPDPDLDIDTSLVQLDLDDQETTNASTTEQVGVIQPASEVYQVGKVTTLGTSKDDQSNFILSELNRQRAESKFVDFSLECNGVIFLCHRCVLAASSPYFDRVISKCKVSDNRVCLDNLKPDALQRVVNFVYTSRLDLGEETAPSVLRAACMLEYPTIIKLCSSFLQKAISPRNCLGFSHLALECRCVDFHQSAWGIALESPTDVYAQDEFLEISVDQLVEYISCDDLNVTVEDIVYEAVMRWVRHDEINRASDLPRILQHLRLPLLSDRLFSSSLESNPLLINSDKCRQLVKEARNLRDSALKGKEMHNDSLKPRPSLMSDLLVVVGGMETSRHWVKDVVYYDPRFDAWETLTSLPFQQTDYSVTTLDDNIYISGGFKEGDATSEVWCYRTAQDKWLQLPNLKLPRFNHTSIGLDGAVFVVGGETDEAGVTEIERYDPLKNVWEIIGEANPTESNLTVAGLNHKLYIIGWLVHTRLMCAVQCFDLETKQCMIQPCSGLNRQLFPVVAFQDAIYILGGSRIKEVAIYDPDTYQSAKAEPMRYKRNTPSVAVVGRRLYVTGGELRHHLDKVEVFDAVANSWSMVSSMPKGLCFHGCVGVRKYLGPPYNEPEEPKASQDAVGTPRTPGRGETDIIVVSQE